ncbi:MAG: AP endonuclease, partial [Clostridiales bacterium]|nr:AP endonuclease [Clostridiales bacterium]
LTTGEEAAAYIHQMLDRHGALCDYIAGVHLHASLSGEKIRSLKRRPPALTGAYFDRLCQAYEHVLAVDGHGPFEAQGLPALIDRIAPEYLTFEFISRSRAEHAGFLTRQNAALGRGAYSALRSGAS